MKKLLLLVCILLVCAAPSYAQVTFTNIDCPGSNSTTTRGINNQGEIVGSYRIETNRHAAMVSNSQCTFLAPTTVVGTHNSEARKNNDRGDVVGYFVGDDGNNHGFFLSKEGLLTTLDFPGATNTEAWGINESGTVVGYFDVFDSGGNYVATHGFIWDGSNFTQVDYPYPPPGSGNTAVFGINARGDLVGGWDDTVVSHGLIRTKQGQFISFDAPVTGAQLTQLTDINANGQIHGVYTDAGGAEHGFLQVGARFTSFDYPGAALTSAWGINSSGQFVGNQFPSLTGPPHGYLAVLNK